MASTMANRQAQANPLLFCRRFAVQRNCATHAPGLKKAHLEKLRLDRNTSAGRLRSQGSVNFAAI